MVKLESGSGPHWFLDYEESNKTSYSECCELYNMGLDMKCVEALQTQRSTVKLVEFPSTSNLTAEGYRGIELPLLWQHRLFLPSHTETTRAAEGQVNYSSFDLSASPATSQKPKQRPKTTSRLILLLKKKDGTCEHLGLEGLEQDMEGKC